MVPRSKTIIAILLVSVLAIAGWQGTTAEPSKLDNAGLKSMLAGLGYEVKEPGEGTYEVAISTAGLNIPTRVFLSKSGTKCWLSVALLAKEDADKLTRDQLYKFLETNVDIGPCHYMIDKGWLKMKMALDNRAITPAVLRTELSYLSDRVGETKALWLKPGA